MSYSPGGSSMSALEKAAERHAGSLMAIPGVEGVAAGADAAGQAALIVYVRDASVATKLPKQVDGHPVSVVVTGAIEAY